MTFFTDILLPYSPVITQGRTTACWAFAMASYWDTEYFLAFHKWIQISPWFMAYHKTIYQQHQTMAFPGFRFRKIPSGGFSHPALFHTFTHGYLTQTEYSWPELKGNSFRNMMRVLNGCCFLGHYLMPFRPFFSCCNKFFLNAFVGKPKSGHDPKQLDLDLIQLTSYEQFPYSQPVVLDLPDNIDSASFYNVHLDDFMYVLDYALEHGHSVVWEGSVRGGRTIYSKTNGIAIVGPDVEVTEHLRDQYFTTGLTKDDHMFHIVGCAHDDSGHTYYISKDSSSRLGPYKGLIYVSREYIMLKTICLTLNRKLFESAISEVSTNQI